MSTTGDSDTIGTTELAPRPHHRDSVDSTEPSPAASAQGFLDTISTGWAERPEHRCRRRASRRAYAAPRREAVSAAFPGKRLVVPPAGP